MKSSAPGFRTEMLILFQAIRNPEVPLFPKLVAGFSLIYLISPIDIIPDVIPVAGWLDDMIIVPLLLHISYKLLPAGVVQESRRRALGQKKTVSRVAWIGLLFIVLLIVTIFWYYHRKM